MTSNGPFSAHYPTGRPPRRPLSTAGVIVMVIAAAAPLAAMIGNTPLALATGRGLAMPALFVAVGAILFCFAAGYAALSRDIVSKGAFYTQVGQGLGKTAGVMAAYSAAIAYCVFSTGIAAAFGYFASLLFHEIGFEVNWLALAATGMFLVAVLGYRSLDLSARVLAWFMIAEFSVLIAFDLAVIANRGLAALPAEVWSPAAWAGPGIGAVIPFVIVSFLGFEAVGLYGEETADPRRSIPVATFAALAVIVVFYMLTVWIIIGAAGPAEISALAQAESGNLVFALATRHGGELLPTLMGVLLVASILASYLAVHNAASRYLFALSSDKLLPGFLSAYHPEHHSPHLASLVMTGFELFVVIGLGLAGVAPYVGIASSAMGFGTIGIIAMQIACCLAVIGFFRRTGRGRRLVTLVLPGLAAAGLTACLVLVIAAYPDLTGSNNPLINGLPWLFLPMAAASFIYARWLKARRPDVFAGVAQADLRPDRTRRAAQVSRYDGRYCIVGAGPAGLVMARALLKEGVPFDCFERHSDVGGLWDPDNTGSPIYDSAHFISSKWTSYFYGFPMPDDYPDYPSWRQILDYIRAFARAYGLYGHITFNTEVIRAEPEGDGWLVTLSTGESRHYAGLIACPGVTWHPNMPELPGASGFSGEIRHSVSYSAPAELAGKRVLVVGAGNSGVDIACDAARHARRAFLSVRRGYRFVPKHLFGIPTDVLMSGLALPPKGIALSGDPNRLLDTLNGDMTRLGLPAPDHDALSSHPIMNTQVLHHLAHGDLVAKPDLRSLDATMAVFADGSREEIDLVLLATGYEYRLPFLDPSLFEWKGGRPQLYLNVMHRSKPGLHVLGFAEFADAAYRRFDDMAQLVVADIHARQTGIGRDWIDARRASHQPDMRGGKTYVDSPRHANYVHAETYGRLLAEFRRHLGWPDLDDMSYAAMRDDAGPR